MSLKREGGGTTANCNRGTIASEFHYAPAGCRVRVEVTYVGWDFAAFDREWAHERPEIGRWSISVLGTVSADGRFGRSPEWSAKGKAIRALSATFEPVSMERATEPFASVEHLENAIRAIVKTANPRATVEVTRVTRREIE